MTAEIQVSETVRRRLERRRRDGETWDELILRLVEEKHEQNPEEYPEEFVGSLREVVEGAGDSDDSPS